MEQKLCSLGCAHALLADSPSRNISMQPKLLVSLSELADTIEWVSAGAPYENAAYVSRVDGKIYWDCEESDDELPEDVEDATRYARVPDKKSLDLGSRVVFRFARRHLGDIEADKVHDIFSRRGAFGRFKQFLDQIGKVQAWYEFRDSAEARAVREWCEQEGLLPRTPDTGHVHDQQEIEDSPLPRT